MTRTHFPVSVASRRKPVFRTRSITAMVLALAIPAHASLHNVPDLADLSRSELEMSAIGENLLDRTHPNSVSRRAGLNSNTVFSSS